MPTALAFSFFFFLLHQSTRQHQKRILRAAAHALQYTSRVLSVRIQTPSQAYCRTGTYSMLATCSGRALLRTAVGGLLAGAGGYNCLPPRARSEPVANAAPPIDHPDARPQRRRPTRAERQAEAADNAFFWEAFKSAMASAGHRVGPRTRADEVFSFKVRYHPPPLPPTRTPATQTILVGRV